MFTVWVAFGFPANAPQPQPQATAATFILRRKRRITVLNALRSPALVSGSHDVAAAHASCIAGEPDIQLEPQRPAGRLLAAPDSPPEPPFLPAVAASSGMLVRQSSRRCGLFYSRPKGHKQQAMTYPNGAYADRDLVGEGLACRRGERLVFARVDFRLRAGGALVLTGTNGSGKSSLLRLMAGLLTPAAGRLGWGGVAVEQEPAPYRAALHYVGHLDAAKPAMTPRETIGFWTSLRGLAPPPTAVDAALAAFDLGAVADWPCRWLSAGQRRRLALARLLAYPAPIWLLDEPTAALDAEGEARLARAVAAHREAGGRVALATHQPIAIEAPVSLVLDEFAATPEEALGLPW
jgi:heme exporter protein A